MKGSPTDRERAIETLHTTAQSFMRARTPDDAAETAVSAIRDILRMPINGVFLYDESGPCLRPAAWTLVSKEIVGDIPTFSPGNSLAWQVFETGESQIHEDVASVEGRFNPNTAIRSEIILPLDDHGVLMIGSDETGAFDDSDVSLALIVATHLRTALDRIEREQALRRQNERLDEFASIVSHDVMNPLNVAQGRLELARDECDSDHLDGAVEAVNRSIELIDDLRTLAREGDRTSDLEAVDLADAVEGCWLNVETNDATLVVETDRTVRADPSRLKQLLENAFRNAIEHGGADVTVTVGDLEDGFSIEDDGRGIPRAIRDRVFDSGFSTREDGTGYGLSIVTEIAEAHGWDVAVAEGTDGGARFEITGVEFVDPPGD